MKNILIFIPLLLVSFAAVAKEPQESPKRLVERLQKEQYQQIQPQQIDRIDILQRDIRRLQAELIDVKVERDEWRQRAIQLQEEQDRNLDQEYAEIIESHLLLIAFFDDFLKKNSLELPEELKMLRQDLQVELATIKQTQGK